MKNWLALAIAILSALGSAYMQYSRSDKDNAVRISALEAHRDDDSAKIDHIQTQVDRLVERLLYGR